MTAAALIPAKPVPSPAPMPAMKQITKVYSINITPFLFIMYEYHYTPAKKGMQIILHQFKSICFLMIRATFLKKIKPPFLSKDGFIVLL